MISYRADWLRRPEPVRRAITRRLPRPAVLALERGEYDEWLAADESTRREVIRQARLAGYRDIAEALAARPDDVRAEPASEPSRVLDAWRKGPITPAMWCARVRDVVAALPGTLQDLSDRIGPLPKTIRVNVVRMEALGLVHLTRSSRGHVKWVRSPDDNRPPAPRRVKDGRTRAGRKNRESVLNAIRDGANTMEELIAATGLPDSTARSWLLRMEGEGVVVVGRVKWKRRITRIWIKEEKPWTA